MIPEQSINRGIGTATGHPFQLKGTENAGGGSINRAAIIEGRDGRRFFVKLNDAQRLPMFEAEAEGLRELAGGLAPSRELRVPAPVCSGADDGQAFLVLEFLDLRGDVARAADRLGRGLATLHRHTAANYGWHRDNTIGATAQRNDVCDDWVTFWRERRLRFQLELAGERASPAMRRDGERLLDALPAFFSSYRPPASLLHGDLWGGNVGATASGEATIFDPAIYYGDRETDLAMTELFGGFPRRFHDAYREAWPLDPGYATRKTLYNLYHVLNHLNLFGGGYGRQAEQMMQALLAELHG